MSSSSKTIDRRLRSASSDVTAMNVSSGIRRPAIHTSTSLRLMSLTGAPCLSTKTASISTGGLEGPGDGACVARAELVVADASSARTTTVRLMDNSIRTEVRAAGRHLQSTSVDVLIAEESSHGFDEPRRIHGLGQVDLKPRGPGVFGILASRVRRQGDRRRLEAGAAQGSQQFVPVFVGHPYVRDQDVRCVLEHLAPRILTVTDRFDRSPGALQRHLDQVPRLIVVL